MPSFEHLGRQYTIEPFAFGQSGKYGCAIYPEGSIRRYVLCEPHASLPQGPCVEFDSPDEATAAGELAIIQDFLRAPLLRQLMHLVKRCQAQHPGRPQRLVIPRMEFADWRKLTQRDWETDGWKAEDQDLTSLDRSDAVFLEALQRQLQRIHITHVRVENALYMRVVPV